LAAGSGANSLSWVRAINNFACEGDVAVIFWAPAALSDCSKNVPRGSHPMRDWNGEHNTWLLLTRFNQWRFQVPTRGILTFENLLTLAGCNHSKLSYSFGAGTINLGKNMRKNLIFIILLIILLILFLWFSEDKNGPRYITIPGVL
jgi:hypothetical protein